MPTPLRESVLAAVADRLQDMIPGVPVERARRAPVGIDERPRLVVRGGDAAADESQSPMETFWTFGVSVSGYVAAASDLAAEQALSTLHAQVMEALQAVDLGPASVQPTIGLAEMALYDSADSSAPAGQFTIILEALAVAPTAHPYAP